MKQLDEKDLEHLPGFRLRPGDTFRFRCHPEVGCFNRCCRNLNLFLYPYDVLRLRARLGVTSDEFLERHADVVLRPGSFFPDVLLRMAENAEKTCPFLTPEGCRVYPTGPTPAAPSRWSRGCGTLPKPTRTRRYFSSGRPISVWDGMAEKQWTVPEWVRDQEARDYHRMTVRWAELRRRFQNDPWGAEGPTGARAKMTFMAAYNIDRFREFLFGSSFLKRFKVDPDVLRKIKKDDAALLLGFDWIKLFLWGLRGRRIKPR